MSSLPISLSSTNLRTSKSWPHWTGPSVHSTLHTHAFSTAPTRHTPRLTHLDEHGQASMVDVADKAPTKRTATAVGRIYIPSIAYDLVTSTYPVDTIGEQGKVLAKAQRKGNALTVAQLAAIMGAKKTSELIPLCHPLALSNIHVKLTPEAPLTAAEDDNHRSKGGRHNILCTATVSCEGKTGVEMEALTAVSVGLLTVWDMLKAVAGKEMEIGEIYVSHKSGGRSGDFTRAIDDESC